MDPSDPSSFACDDRRLFFNVPQQRPVSPFKSPESFQNSADDLANFDPSYWEGASLDGDVALIMPDPNTAGEGASATLDDSDDEQFDQLESSEPRPPQLPLPLLAAPTSTPSPSPLSLWWCRIGRIPRRRRRNKSGVATSGLRLPLPPCLSNRACGRPSSPRRMRAPPARRQCSGEQRLQSLHPRLMQQWDHPRHQSRWTIRIGGQAMRTSTPPPRLPTQGRAQVVHGSSALLPLAQASSALLPPAQGSSAPLPPAQGSSVPLPPAQGLSAPLPPAHAARGPPPDTAPTFGPPPRIFVPRASALACPPPPPPQKPAPAPPSLLPAPPKPASPLSSPLPPPPPPLHPPPLSFPPITCLRPSLPGLPPPAAPIATYGRGLSLPGRPPPAAPIATYGHQSLGDNVSLPAPAEPEQRGTPEPDRQVLTTPVVSPTTITIMNFQGSFGSFLEEGEFVPMELPPSPLPNFDHGPVATPHRYVSPPHDIEDETHPRCSSDSPPLTPASDSPPPTRTSDSPPPTRTSDSPPPTCTSDSPPRDAEGADSEEVMEERAGQKRKRTSLPGGKLTAAQEAGLTACCAKMFEVAAACATETNLSQERVLRRFTSSISDVHSRRPHRWNLYQSYAQHEFNRTTELRRTVEGCETSPDAEVAPLTKAQLSEAYTQFVLDYGDDKAEEILAKHLELVAAEEGPTVEGRQRRFGTLMRRWGGTRSPQLESIEARDDFQALFMMAGPHVHQDSEYAEVRYTEGFARFFEKLKYTQDEVLAAAKSAVYDWELTKLHELKGRGDVHDPSDAPDTSTSNTSNAVASSSQQALTKIERASAKVPPVKHDYKNMTDEEIKRAKRQLADARIKASKQLNLLIQGRIKRMSVSNTGTDHFIGNGFMWTIAPQYFAGNNLRMLGYLQGEARLPMEEYPSKGASGWRVIERDGLTEALDARGTRNEGLRMESHQYKKGDIVIFSFDYSAPVPSIDSPGYDKHWRTSHRKAVPCADGEGKLWRVVYDLDRVPPVISQVSMALRLPAGGKKMKEAALLATEAGSSKGKGKAKSKMPVEDEEDELDVEEIPDPESEEDAPSPPKKQRTKPPVKERAPTVASASSARVTAARRTRTTSGGTSRGAATSTSTSRSAAASSGSSTSAAPDPSNSAAEAPRRGARKIDGHPASTSAAPASAAEPAADELRRRTRSRTQEQQGGGPVKKVKFDPATYVDSDSGGSSDFFLPDSDCNDDEVPQRERRTVYSPYDAQPLGEAYLRPDGSYIGQMMERPAPTPPASQKRGKTFAGVVIPTKPKEPRPRPRPVGKKRRAAAASTSGAASPPPPASADDAPADAPAAPAGLPVNAPQTAAALALPTDAGALLGNLMVVLAQFPLELLSGALAGAQAMQQHQPPQ
ncbi:hypothetical protein B0H14DRAFT_2640778 [Mycena olivaceomarginata]|nr:hypothetical protein B0H14DRAFT_2640778 [Mycena olivaceomarginata]